MEGLDSSREERDGGVPRGPGGPPHQINAGPRVQENYVALPLLTVAALYRQRTEGRVSKRLVPQRLMRYLQNSTAGPLPHGRGSVSGFLSTWSFRARPRGHPVSKRFLRILQVPLKSAPPQQLSRARVLPSLQGMAQVIFPARQTLR